MNANWTPKAAKDLKIVFFGTPPFAAKVLEHLLDQGADICAVVTKPDRPQGRSLTLVPTAVKSSLQKRGLSIPLFQPEIVSEPDFAPTLAAFDADLFVVVAYGEIIKQHLLDLPKLACINLHASLLPKYRGAAPIQRCLIEGESKSGVTIMHMVKKMDAGDIIATAEVAIDEEMTFGTLEGLLCDAGCRLLLQAIEDLAAGRAKREPQDPSKVTFAPKIELQDCKIDWHRPATEIHNLVRGVSPQPGAWCMIAIQGEQKRLRILTTRLSRSSPPAHMHVEPAAFIKGKDTFIVATGRGLLDILTVQLEGKRTMSAGEFMRGNPSFQLLQ